MSLRITDKTLLKKWAAKGLIKQSDVNCTSNKAGANNSKTKSHCDNAIMGGVCPLVPINPADILYQRLVNRFGRFHEGGQVVYELEFSFDNRRWRMDMAIPERKLAIELDGYMSHGRNLSGFKRDREKALCFERRGWRVLRFSSAQIRNEITDVLSAIEQVLSHCTRVQRNTLIITNSAFDRSRYIESE